MNIQEQLEIEFLDGKFDAILPSDIPRIEKFIKTQVIEKLIADIPVAMHLKDGSRLDMKWLHEQLRDKWLS